MMDVQREFENFEACMEGHETAYQFFEAGWKARDSQPRSVETALGTAKVLSEGQQEPAAWERKWHFDGVAPEKEKNEKGRLVWPAKFRFLPITKVKIFSDDVPLYRTTPPAQPVQPAAEINEQLLEALRIAGGSIMEICKERNVPIPQSTMRRIDAAIAAAEAAKGV